MNILIGSDIHGSLKYAKMFFQKAEKYEAKKIVLLGDCYYNGARNDPPEEYCPKEVVKLLNSYADKIIAVKGNCESEVDQMVSDFVFNENATMFVFGKQVLMTHGHHASMNQLPKACGDIFLQGHTHVSVLKRNEAGLILANPGSISLPKDQHHSYLVMNEKGMFLYDLLSDELLEELEF